MYMLCPWGHFSKCAQLVKDLSNRYPRLMKKKGKEYILIISFFMNLILLKSICKSQKYYQIKNGKKHAPMSTYLHSCLHICQVDFEKVFEIYTTMIFRCFSQHRIHNNISITKISSLSKIKPLLYTPYASKLALVLCMYPMHTCSLLNHL